MHCCEYDDGQTLVLEMSGQLTFNDHVEMKRLTRMIAGEGRKAVVVDLADVEFIDSAAIGMLLILGEETGRTGGTLTFDEPQGQVARVLLAAKIADIVPVRMLAVNPDILASGY